MKGHTAETSLDALENRLCGLGKMMRESQFTKAQRLHVARCLHVMLKSNGFDSINRARVFSRFFALGELSEDDWTLDIKT